LLGRQGGYFPPEDERSITAKTKALEDQLLYFNDFFQTFRRIGVPSQSEPSKELKSILTYYDQTTENLKAILQIATRRTQHRLTKLSIEESQRSIREAFSVGKLTQLSFIFIPPSFATSLFGMNLDELTGVGPRFGVFIITLMLLFVLVLLAWNFEALKDGFLDLINRF
jgi:Mg2+ and Co2+ transporter CorA